MDVPVLEGNIPGAELDFTFDGTAVGVSVLSGPDAGMIQYSIDGGKEQMLNLFTELSAHLHLSWFVLLGDDLPEGPHQLKLKIANHHDESATGTACRIVHFMINGK